MGRNEHTFVSPVKPRSLEIFKRSFPVGFIDAWNGLPKHLFEKRISPESLQCFKKAVNAHLFRKTS